MNACRQQPGCERDVQAICTKHVLGIVLLSLAVVAVCCSSEYPCGCICMFLRVLGQKAAVIQLCVYRRRPLLLSPTNGSSMRAGTGDGSGGGGGGPGPAADAATVAHVKTAVEMAIRDLQRELRHDLHDQDIQIFGLLGRGGFGTVHHGAPSPPFPLSPPPPRGLTYTCIHVRTHSFFDKPVITLPSKFGRSDTLERTG